MKNILWKHKHLKNCSKILKNFRKLTEIFMEFYIILKILKKFRNYLRNCRKNEFRRNFSDQGKNVNLGEIYSKFQKDF